MERVCAYLVTAVIAAGLASCNRTKPEPPPPAETPITTDLLPTLNRLPEPELITINLTLSSLQDLKVKPGEQIKAGQVLSDRTQERNQYAATKQQLLASLNKLEVPIEKLELSLAAPKPVLPEPTSPQQLPPPSYAAEAAAIKLKAKALKDVQGAIARTKQKISQLQTLLPTARDPATRYQLQLTIDHEQAKLRNIESLAEEAQIQLEIAQAQLATAKERRVYTEYQQQTEAVRQALAIEQQRLEIQKQETQRRQQLQMMAYNKAQIQAQIQEVDSAIAQLDQVKSPYAGVVEDIRWVSQNNNDLTVELTLDISDEGSNSAVSKQLSPVYRTTRIQGDR